MWNVLKAETNYFITYECYISVYIAFELHNDGYSE
jgi:hypothetical protein